MHLQDEAHSEYTIGSEIKSGGEGGVYNVVGRPDVVAKIYHDLPDETRIAKLRAMVARTSPKLLEVAAWPLSLLHDRVEYRGFLMPRVSGEEIHQLFNPGERARKFPNRRWDFLINAARNCADAFDALHEAGVIMGDVNEANILVLPDGCIRLIDCDSFQVAREGTVFTCDVGVDQWIPPELQNAPTLRGVPRSRNHDLFGLAVLIFKLVFMGRHPYAGVPLNPGEFELEKAIADFHFAFSPCAQNFGMRPPPHSLLLDKFPESVTKMFEAAFLRGSEQREARPTAVRWRNALEVVARHLKECERRPWHLFTTNLRSHCPWCEIQAKGGPDYFECVAVASAIPSAANTGGLWERIDSIKELAFESLTFETVSVPAYVTQPFAPSLTETRGSFVGGWLIIAAAVIAAAYTGGASLFGVLVGLIMLSGGSRTPEFNTEVAKRRSAASDAEFQVRAVLDLLRKLQTDYQMAFRQKRTAFRASFDDLGRLTQQRQREFEKLQASIHERCLQVFLAQHFIARASITGIGEGRKAMLVSHGIETAWDVQNRINVPGFGPVLVSNLMAWKREIVARFRLPPNAQIPESDIAQLDARILARHRTLELLLRSAPEDLANLNREISLRVSSARQQLAAALAGLGQARANLSNVPK